MLPAFRFSEKGCADGDQSECEPQKDIDAKTDREEGDCSPISIHQILRKEVIQPQVPLRLPCYDFVPITSLTLGRRLF